MPKVSMKRYLFITCIYTFHDHCHEVELDRKTDVTGLIWISIPEIMLLGLGDMPQLMSTSL